MPEMNINVNINKIPWMKCICGGEKFIRVCKLKCISPFYSGAPKPLTWEAPMFKCLNPKCGMEYDEALDAADIKKLKNKLLEGAKSLADLKVFEAAENPGKGETDG